MPGELGSRMKRHVSNYEMAEPNIDRLLPMGLPISLFRADGATTKNDVIHIFRSMATEFALGWHKFIDMLKDSFPDAFCTVMDLLGRNFLADPEARLSFGDGRGGFGMAVRIGAPLSGSEGGYAVIAGDFTGDGLLDILIGSSVLPQKAR